MIPVTLMMIIQFNYLMLMIFELYTVVFFYLIMVDRSSFERSNANSYLMFFGYVLRGFVVINNDLVSMRILLLVLGMAKLPIFRLHI